MAQRIIDLDVVVPEAIGVQIEGDVYDIPGDIPVPQYLRIARLTDALEDKDGDPGQALEDLYEEVLDLFRVQNPDLDELPIGAARLGALVVQLYTQAAEDDAPRPTKPRRGGTRSTKPKRTKRSGSSK